MSSLSHHLRIHIKMGFTRDEEYLRSSAWCFISCLSTNGGPFTPPQSPSAPDERVHQHTPSILGENLPAIRLESTDATNFKRSGSPLEPPSAATTAGIETLLTLLMRRFHCSQCATAHLLQHRNQVHFSTINGHDGIHREVDSRNTRPPLRTGESPHDPRKNLPICDRLLQAYASFEWPIS